MVSSSLWVAWQGILSRFCVEFFFKVFEFWTKKEKFLNFCRSGNNQNLVQILLAVLLRAIYSYNRKENNKPTEVDFHRWETLATEHKLVSVEDFDPNCCQKSSPAFDFLDIPTRILQDHGRLSRKSRISTRKSRDNFTDFVGIFRKQSEIFQDFQDHSRSLKIYTINSLQIERCKFSKILLSEKN